MKDVLLEIIRKKESELGLNGIEELYKLVMDDRQPSFAKGAYVFIETEDNWGSSFRAASELIKRDAATEVFSVYHKKLAGSPGYFKWKEKLERFVGFGRVRYIRLDNLRGFNTLSESVALVEFAHENEINSFYLVAPPFHMLRTFMTAASVAIRNGSEINFFACPGAPQDLNQNVLHSQGKGPFPRWKWFELELKTISDYSEKNGIPLTPGLIKYESIQDIINYMKRRKTDS